MNKVLSKLGLNDCFDEIVCFESLNPTPSNVHDQSVLTDTSTSALYKEGSAVPLPDTPIVCKPFEDAFVQAFKIANINPQTTVSYIYIYNIDFLVLYFLDQFLYYKNYAELNGLVLKVFFDDSIRNIQSGKRMGLHTVLVWFMHVPILRYSFFNQLLINQSM